MEILIGLGVMLWFFAMLVGVSRCESSMDKYGYPEPKPKNKRRH